MSSEPRVAMKPPYPLHPSVVDKLSPQYVAFYNEHLLNLPQAHFQTVTESRAGSRINPGTSQPLPVGRILDFVIPRQSTTGPDIRLRSFTPKGEHPPNGWPIIVYFHGGGWVFGNIDTENTVCTHLCARASCVVITTDYRLAPEFPFPAAAEDSWEALHWMILVGSQVLKLDLSKVAVGGSSAGANLAAVMTQKILGRPDIGDCINIKVQLLVVPVTDNTATPESNPTWNVYENTAGLPAAKMLWYRNLYLPNECARGLPEASPLLFRGDFGQLPPAVILVGEVDVLRHEGEEYAKKLRVANVDTRLELMVGMPHAFLALDAVLDEGRRAITILCETLIEVFR